MRERARRGALERANEEVQQRGGVARRGRFFAEASFDKVPLEAKIRAERGPVERATAEARERAQQKALSERASHGLKEQLKLLLKKFMLLKYGRYVLQESCCYFLILCEHYASILWSSLRCRKI